MPIRLGNSRCQPRGMVEPWKSTTSWKSAASFKRSRYCAMRSCLSLCQKSTLMPLTPQAFSCANSLSRCSCVNMRSRGASVTSLCGPPELYQKSRPTCFALRVRDDVLDGAALHDVPVGVDQRILPAHVRREIGEGVELLRVLRAVAHRPPAPRGAARLDPCRRSNRRSGGDVEHQIGLDDVAGLVADHDDAPRHRPGERRFRVRLADAQAFAAIGKREPIRAARRALREMRPGVGRVERGLGDQRPLPVTRLEQRGEVPAVGQLGRRPDLDLGVEILVRRRVLADRLPGQHPRG